MVFGLKFRFQLKLNPGTTGYYKMNAKLEYHGFYKLLLMYMKVELLSLVPNNSLRNTRKIAKYGWWKGEVLLSQ